MDPEERAVEEKLKKLHAHMDDMAHNDMGWLSFEQAALFHAACSLIGSIIEVRSEEKSKVVVEVSGGVAEVSECPPGVDVEIIDHDNLEAEEEERRAAEGH